MPLLLLGSLHQVAVFKWLWQSRRVLRHDNLLRHDNVLQHGNVHPGR